MTPSVTNAPAPDALRQHGAAARAFVWDRGAFVRGAVPGQLDAPALGARARLFVHVLPLGGEDDVHDDLASRRWELYAADGVRPRQGDGRAGAERFGIDGYRVEYDVDVRPLAYVQHFHNGGAEYATTEFHADDDGAVLGLRSADVTRGVMAVGAGLLDVVARVRQVPPPWIAYLSIYDLAGLPLLDVSVNWAQTQHAEEEPHRFERNALVLPPIVIPGIPADLRAAQRAFRPLADRLWQCAGYPQAATSGW